MSRFAARGSSGRNDWDSFRLTLNFRQQPATGVKVADKAGRPAAWKSMRR